MKKYFFFILIISISFESCSDTENEDTLIDLQIPEGTNLRVNYFTRTCEGITTQQCLLVQEMELFGTREWNFFFSNI